MADLRENIDLFTDHISEQIFDELTKEQVTAELIQMAENIEKAKRNAERKYNIPEFVKERIIREEECYQKLRSAAEMLRNQNIE